MGLNFFHSSGSCPAPGQPVPHRFSIRLAEQRGPFCIALVHYPDATVYNGKKLLLYHAREKTIREANALDPHFTETGLSPIARFEPTKRGWAMARLVADKLDREA